MALARMSALGQKRSFNPDQPHARFAPIADIDRLAANLDAHILLAFGVFGPVVKW